MLKNNLKKFQEGVKALSNKRVMVGVPASDTTRNNSEGGPITNAALAYIHTNGAPEANIPPRPFLVPGIDNAKGPITANLKAAGKAILDGDNNKADQALNAAGLVAVASVKEKIVDGPFEPLALRTIQARLARGVTRTKPLIDTGQLLASINYVIRDKGKS